MSTCLTINKLKKDNIFCSDFLSLENNNEIEFNNNQKIAVLYGPNGTGKTSLAKVFSREQGTEYELKYNNMDVTNETEKDIFHVISDQNSRNIIEGEETDFLIGDNIRKEYELKTKLDDSFMRTFDGLNKIYKNEYGIKKVSSKVFSYIKDSKLSAFLKDIVNQKNKGKRLDYEEVINYIKHSTIVNIQDYEEEKLNFLKANLEGSLINIILNLDKELLNLNSQNILELEENEAAIEILNKFDYINDCIVCETKDINTKKLKSKKNQHNIEIVNNLNDNEKAIIENVLNKIKGNDPLSIRKALYMILNEGDVTELKSLVHEINRYIEIYRIEVKNKFIKVCEDAKLEDIFQEYSKVKSEQLELVEEDLLFIQNIISESIDKELKIERTKENKISILLENEQLLNKDRNELHLSNGEQNFISLTFELLKAKNTQKEVIIIDDPISSFDSIFKNKIAYAIIRFLENKNQIILSHNVDLIRLLEHQKNNCFNLYLLNNTDGELNGIIPVSNCEKKILLSIPEFLEILKSDIFNEIYDEKAFLISLVPFLRGYAQITLDIKSKNELTKIMHGYNSEKVNITHIYSNLIKPTRCFKNNIEISSQDIINYNVKNAKVLKEDTNYKLLKRSLFHTLNYLFLRLSVEKNLVDLYKINTKKYDMLSKIIFKAFSDKSIKENIKHRAFFASKKTLLNEFNHFDGNMSVFFPALDITDKALENEREAILNYLEKLNPQTVLVY